MSETIHPVPQTEIVKHEATSVSNQFLKKEERGVRHILGTVFRTAATETLTFLGPIAMAMGLGLGAAGVMGAGAALSHGVGELVGPFLGLGAVGSFAVGGVGLGATAYGVHLGWEGAKHTESSRTLYKIGKVAEFAAIPASLLIPGIYPIAKAFSIAATGISNWMRPAGK